MRRPLWSVSSCLSVCLSVCLGGVEWGGVDVIGEIKKTGMFGSTHSCPSSLSISIRAKSQSLPLCVCSKCQYLSHTKELHPKHKTKPCPLLILTNSLLPLSGALMTSASSTPALKLPQFSIRLSSKRSLDGSTAAISPRKLKFLTFEICFQMWKSTKGATCGGVEVRDTPEMAAEGVEWILKFNLGSPDGFVLHI